MCPTRACLPRVGDYRSSAIPRPSLGEGGRSAQADHHVRTSLDGRKDVESNGRRVEHVRPIRKIGCIAQRRGCGRFHTCPYVNRDYRSRADCPERDNPVRRERIPITVVYTTCSVVLIKSSRQVVVHSEIRRRSTVGDDYLVREEVPTRDRIRRHPKANRCTACNKACEHSSNRKRSNHNM